MIEGEFQVLGDAYIDYAFNGRERRRVGNAHPSMAPHDVFRCKGEDAWVAIAVDSDRQFAALCNVIGRPDLAGDPRFADAASRKQNELELREPITAWTSERTHIEAQDALQAGGVPAGAALDANELLENRHVHARNGIAFVDTPGIGPAPCLRMAFKLSDTPLPIASPAPCFGDANDDVLGGLLGLTRERIAELERLRVTSRVPLAP